MEKEMNERIRSINRMRLFTLASYILALFLALLFIVRAIASRSLDYGLLVLTLVVYAFSSFVVEKKYTSTFIRENMIMSLGRYLSSIVFSRKGSVGKEDVIDVGAYPIAQDEGRSFVSSDEVRGEHDGARCTLSSFISYFPDTRTGAKHKFALMKGVYISSKLPGETPCGFAIGSSGVLDDDVAKKFYKGQGLSEIVVSDDAFSYSSGNLPGNLRKLIENILNQAKAKDVKVLLRVRKDRVVLIEKNKEVNVRLPLLKKPSEEVLEAPALPLLSEYFALLDELIGIRGGK